MKRFARFAQINIILIVLMLFVACQPAANQPKKLDKIGVQLYTLRGEMGNDFEGTLKKVADLGYKEVEFAGYYDNSPEEIRAMLDKYGLTAPAAHLGFPLLTTDLDKTIAAAKVIGHEYLILPWINGKDYDTVEKYKELAQQLNEIGKKAQAAGMRVGYHNHGFEFESVEGQKPYDILLKNTDPNLVDFEMDLHWAIRAGQDPLAYFAAYPGRFKLCHVKDMTVDSSMADVGAGMIDFGKIFAHADQAGLQHFIVEHDHPENADQSIANSIAYLKKLTF